VWRPRPALIGLILLVLSASAACRERSRGRELHVIWESGVQTLDPNEKFEFLTDTVAMNVFEPLVRYDRQMAFQAGLATAWEIREGAIWRFRLREGVRFHDGSTFTAEDVAFSIARLKARPDRDIHQYVSAISEVRVVDPWTIDVRSERPAGLLSVLSFVYILPKGTCGRLGEEAFFQAPSGTGPYRIAEWRKGTSLRLEAYDGYWGARPSVPAAIFQVVKGDDAMWREALRLSPAIVFSPTRTTWAAHHDDRQFRLVEHPGLAVQYLVLRVTGGAANPLSDVRVRRALREAIDYRRLISVMPGEGAFPASQLVPPAIIGFNPGLSVPSFDPGAARRLLDESGFHQEKPLKFLIRAGGGPLSRELLADFNAAGVDVSAEEVGSEEFERRSTACDADLFLSGWICSTGDAGELFEGNFYSKESRGHACGYGSAEMDAAIEEIGRTLDPAARRDLLQKTMKRLVDDLPWIPLIVTYDRHAMTPGVEWETRADGQLDLRDVRLK
jgi:peptide/nickel transport system substrate-binding protein